MAGLASLCLAFLHYIVDVRVWRRWTQPALVFGRNAIAVYVLAGVTARLLYVIRVPGSSGTPVTLKSRLYWVLFTSWLDGPNASLAFALAFILVMYACMLPLYRRKIFFKI
jgi:predicted acyltransferase